MEHFLAFGLVSSDDVLDFLNSSKNFILLDCLKYLTSEPKRRRKAPSDRSISSTVHNIPKQYTNKKKNVTENLRDVFIDELSMRDIEPTTAYEDMNIPVNIHRTQTAKSSLPDGWTEVAGVFDEGQHLYVKTVVSQQLPFILHPRM